MNVYLVRHGQTAHNRDGLGLGREDAPLTPLGELQTRAVARRLAAEHVERVLSSPLGRARRMAEAIAAEHGLPVELRDELIEMDVGDTEGLSYAEMRERFPGFMRAWASPGFGSVRMPNGESLEDVARRLQPIVTELRTGQEKGIVIVSHNFITKVLICDLLGLPVESMRSFTVDVASICTFVLHHGRIAVSGLNDCCHLDSLNVEEPNGNLST